MDGRSTLVELRKELREAAEGLAEAASDLRDRLEDVKGGLGGLPVKKAEGIFEQVGWSQDLMARTCADVQRLIDGDLMSFDIVPLERWESLANEGQDKRIG